jgi:hypothetical protein
MATRDISDLQVVEAARDSCQAGYRPRRTIALLVERTGQPEKVCLRAMERAARRGLIVCGMSINCSWPTAAGEDLLSRSTKVQAQASIASAQ